MALHSTYWYKVADIRPCLRNHIRFSRHVYRGQSWYVLQDRSSNRQQRFNRTAYGVIGLMDGEKTVEQIWTAVSAALGDDAPTQDEMIRLLGQLHEADVLQSDSVPDSLELFHRQRKQQKQWKHRFKNPFAVRFPLIDPDRFLVRWLFFVRPLCGRLGLLVWLFVVGWAIIAAGLNWPNLTHDIADRLLTPENLLLLWLVFPVVKLLHELGHAFAARVWGAEVHEMGIILLALTPIPYVEASATAAFASKYRRIAVSAAGMAVELFVSALALFVWLNVETGRVSALAYNVMVVGGVSTLLFNGNPLLRFDGYYILADWLEIPNLYQRSTRYLGYLVQRYLLGLAETVSPVTAPGERVWFVFYGVCAFCYRLVVLFGLALFVSTKFFVIGVLIAVWAVAVQIVVPALRHTLGLYLRMAGRRRLRYVTVSLLAAVFIGGGFFVVPMPMKTQVQGVVSLPEYSRVRTGVDCFITHVLAESGRTVRQGDPLLQCDDPYLQTEMQILQANVEEARARYIAEPLQSRSRRTILKDEIVAVEADLQRSKERLQELIVRSPSSGSVILPGGAGLVGRFVEQGSLLGYIFGVAESIAVVVVDQTDISLVRDRTRRVEVRLAGRLDHRITTTIAREIPAASDYLPSAVLSTHGGGRFLVAPGDSRNLQSLEKTFQVEINLPIAAEDVRIGERVHVVFDHGYEPIGVQWYIALRQLFLRKFHV